MHRGSNIVVIGRPITAAKDPQDAAMQFADEYWSMNEK
jgi:orotidine-5'-phosphate decarboxylase